VILGVAEGGHLQDPRMLVSGNAELLGEDGVRDNGVMTRPWSFLPSSQALNHWWIYWMDHVYTARPSNGAAIPFTHTRPMRRHSCFSIRSRALSSR
jgi:hypothetical protein